MFSRVLIANRGEIARRIQRTLRRLRVESVAVFSAADAHAPHVAEADHALPIGPAPSAQSYLNVAALLDAARRSGAQAVHPGYGFLSENPAFAEACEAAGLAFIGPTAASMRELGLKHRARAVAARLGLPLLEGTGVLAEAQEAARQAARIGYPVILKSSAGGGGIGMAVCENEEELLDAIARTRHLGGSHFGDTSVFLERYVSLGRHIEVQIFGDGGGRAISLGERDCSLQRRKQKVIEETPAPGLPDATRAAMEEAAVRLAAAVHYRSAGTVEFLYDVTRGAFSFLEVNTRLQVEHGVTELVTGIDLVEWMVRLAAGEDILPASPPPRRGAAVQARLYAEDPARQFQPSTGTLTEVRFPSIARVDSGVLPGGEVTPHYDPLLAKVLTHGANREEAHAALRAALRETAVHGVETNREFLLALLEEAAVREGTMHVKFAEGVAWAPRGIEVVRPGTQTSVQDVPGRLGFWAVGVPPSGPMDELSFRLGNRLLGNPPDAAGLECTLTGPTLRFHEAGAVVLTGADMQARLNGAPAARHTVLKVQPGDELALSGVHGPGQRAYVLVAGGIDVPAYLGSRSTFLLGQFGGHGGRALRAGDRLRVRRDHLPAVIREAALAEADQPPLTREWLIGVQLGPHIDSDFFTPADIDILLATAWEVHFNSDRTGVRLIGPKPEWARPDGGEAGLHPSNIHDNPYAVGALDFTGDLPILLGPDGPSLGGFVCPLTVVSAERWKLGQLQPGDRVRFSPLDAEEAAALAAAQRDWMEHLRAPPPLAPSGAGRRAPAVLLDLPATAFRPRVVLRRCGDEYLLIEAGALELDLALRFFIHALLHAVAGAGWSGVVDLTPGIRSLQIHVDATRLPLDDLVRRVADVVSTLPPLDDLRVPSRVVRLPLSWDDPATHVAIERYSKTVRADAPWCPSNIEFIRRINGLESLDDVRQIVFNARYLVLGLGDVYLGAPVATPLDPRHRLVTTKYNPARTWTAENSVGIGGAYLCVYGMEGPGGYQFVGRTVQMWNRHRVTRDFPADARWCLRCFDQIVFEPVSAERLLELRRDFLNGTWSLHVEEAELDLGRYRAFLRENEASIRAFKARQQSAFEAERTRWAEAGVSEPPPPPPPAPEVVIPPGCVEVPAPVTGSTWKVLVQSGEWVRAGQPVVILESMKMEIEVSAATAGRVERLLTRPGEPVLAGSPVAALRPSDTP
jgi:urea carboxylase